MIDAERPSVSRAVGNQNSEAITERGDLSVERIYFVAPSAVEKHDWRARARVAIVDLDRADARSERRFIDGCEGQLLSPARSPAFRRKFVASFRERTISKYKLPPKGRTTNSHATFSLRLPKP